MDYILLSNIKKEMLEHYILALKEAGIDDYKIGSTAYDTMGALVPGYYSILINKDLDWNKAVLDLSRESLKISEMIKERLADKGYDVSDMKTSDFYYGME